MAKNSEEIVIVLRNTADRLEKSNMYQWGHMGSCNCGFLAQEISSLNKDEIHARAMQRHGNWNEQLNDYCPTSGLLIDDLITQMFNFGFDSNDLKHLEKLSDPIILRTLPYEERNLRHNVKSDVVKYFRTWAEIIEKEVLSTIEIKELSDEIICA